MEVPPFMHIFPSKDRKEGALMSAAFNVIFSDGLAGIITVTKLTDDPHWQPRQDIKQIIIEKC